MSAVVGQPSNLSPPEVQELFNELDRERNMNSMLKNINETLEKYIKELEDKLMEFNENSQLSVKQVNVSGEGKEQEDRLQSKINIYEEKMNNLLQENARLIEQHENMRAQVHQEGQVDFENQYDQMKGRLEVMLKENQKLVDIIEENNEEIEMWRNKYNDLNSNYTVHMDELKRQLEFQKDMSLEQEINEKTKHIIAEKEDLLERMQEKDMQHQQAKRQCSDIQNEYNKVNALLQEKVKQNETLNNSVNNMSHWEMQNYKLQQEIIGVNAKLDRKKEQLEVILDENNKLNEQADHFTKELRCSHQLLQEYKSKERVLEDRIEEEM